jgi:hypothetical protein
MITSRMIYGSGTPTDLSRVNATRGRRQYALRTSNAPQGYTPKPRQIDPEREQARLRLEQAKLMRQLQRESERERAEKTRAYLESVRHVEQYN